MNVSQGLQDIQTLIFLSKVDLVTKCSYSPLWPMGHRVNIFLVNI